jgi:hypothetical protein
MKFTISVQPDALKTKLQFTEMLFMRYQVVYVELVFTMVILTMMEVNLNLKYKVISELKLLTEKHFMIQLIKMVLCLVL